MKTGLILEGGAMRGMFTAGVLDIFMENNITFDGTIGVSAGAVFGCNLKSRQPGRVIRYNKKYCRDPRYVSFRSLLKTGDLYGKDFAYYEVPQKLDIWDTKAFRENPMEFYVVCTDAKTGKPVYHKCENGDSTDIEWMRASASMPAVSRLVEINGLFLSDGGTADAVPLRYFESLGYDRNIVVLTQPEGYVKEKNPYLPVLRLLLRKTPALYAAVGTRHIFYNETIRYITEKEKSGGLLVIRPSGPLNIGKVEKNPDELERVYQMGRRAAQDRLEEIKAFL